MTPPPAATCPVCGAAIVPGTDRCGRCGTLSGEHRVCYGCGARAEVIEKAGVWTCAACGRPRVPMEKPGVPRSGRERAVLAKVEQAHKRAIVAKGLGIAAIAADVFVGLVLAIAALAGFTALAIAIAIVTALVAASAFVAFGRSRAAAEEARLGMREAIGLVALDVMRAKGGLSAPELAEQLGVPVAQAEAALDRLPARDDVQVESVVDERSIDGQVRYRIPASAVSVRPPGASAPQAVDTNARTLSLEEMADDEQLAFDARLQAAIEKKKLETK
jgi:predicted RNA-binding Zn-ribbon protein involved in translation (DUF1610 family)